MIKGKKKGQLTKEKILERISGYDIYRFYHGNFKVNQVSVNRHRGEVNPSLIIGNKISDQLTHKDFGDYSWRGDAFHFVEQVHGCDFLTALKIIDRDFNLGLGGGKVVEGRKIVTWSQPEVLTKRPPVFDIVTLPTLTNEGWKYWNRHYQGEEDIRRENIFMPKEIWRNKKKMYLGTLLTFCYWYPEVGWKIYRPFAEKRIKNTPIHKWKWDTNLPFDYVENLGNVENGCKIALLGKSKKDRMVIMKALETQCIANIQAEDPSCISQITLEVFKNVENRYAVMDNDKKGVEVSWWLTNQHGFKHCNVPYEMLDKTGNKITDFAHMAESNGLQSVRDHFKNKGIC